MNLLASTVLLASLAVGIDTGYEPTSEGGLEYIIQIPPNLLDTLKPGEVISSEIPHEVQGVRRYRIQVGTDRLPRIQLPSSFNPATESMIQQTSGGGGQAIPQTPPQALDKQSPFQPGPVTKSTNTTNWNNDRYGAQPGGVSNGTAFVANSNAAQGQEFTELPLKLPAPPDGYPENYNGWNTTNNTQPANTGLQNVPPANFNQPNQNQPNQNQPNQNWQNNPQWANQQWQNPNTGQPNVPNGWNGNPNQNNQGAPYSGYPQQGNQYYNGQPNQGMVNVNTGMQPGMSGSVMPGFPQQNYGQNMLPPQNQGNLAQVPSQGSFPNQPRIADASTGVGITADNKAGTTFASNSAGNKSAAGERTVSFREELSPGDVTAAERAKSAAASTMEKPWLPMYVTGFAAVGSLLGNLYLAWMWLETRRRYRQIILERALAV